MVLNVLFMKIYKVKVMQNESNFVVMHSKCMFITTLIRVHWRIITYNINIQSTKNKVEIISMTDNIQQLYVH